MRYLLRLTGVDHAFPCAAGESALAALSPVHHVHVRSGCHGGGCGVCKVRVHDGAYRTGCMSRAHVSDEERDSGVVLACRLYPESDMTIEPWGKLSARLARRGGIVPVSGRRDGSEKNDEKETTERGGWSWA